jgi:hypothetical protein
MQGSRKGNFPTQKYFWAQPELEPGTTDQQLSPIDSAIMHVLRTRTDEYEEYNVLLADLFLARHVQRIE